MSFYTVNPATQGVLHSYEYATDLEIEKTLVQALQNFLLWKNSFDQERKTVLLALAKILRFHQDELAELMTHEMGKSTSEALAEIEKCAWTAEYFAQNLEKIKDTQKVSLEDRDSEIVFEPMGVILAIMPWNFPLWQILRFAIPALAAGNIVVMKHSDITAGTAQLLEKLFNNAHPKLRLLFNMHFSHDKSEKIISDSRICGVTVTGSTQTGRLIAEICGRHLKKCVMELGGSDPYLVLRDADLSLAAQMCANSRMQNNGQSCIAAKRFIVERSVLKAFVEFLKIEMSNKKLLPLAAEKFQLQTENQIEQLLNLGGKIELGGEVLSSKGAFYPATIIVFDKNDNRLGEMEIFAPVAIVIAVDSVEEAVLVANASSYGLGAGVFTRDEKKGRAVMHELQVGSVVLNSFVKTDPRLPFGGVKNSGFGRELSHFGFYEFCNIKTISVGRSI